MGSIYQLTARIPPQGSSRRWTDSPTDWQKAWLARHTPDWDSRFQSPGLLWFRLVIEYLYKLYVVFKAD